MPQRTQDTKQGCFLQRREGKGRERNDTGVHDQEHYSLLHNLFSESFVKGFQGKKKTLLNIIPQIMKSLVVLLCYVFTPLKTQLKKSLLPEFWLEMEKNGKLEPRC